MTPKESKGFLIFLGLTALLWALGGAAVWGQNPEARGVFFRVFFWVLLDLGFLVFFFWRLFFAPVRSLLWRFQVGTSFTLKLVCLGFLAITLKELRNDPHLPAVAGILFLCVGPLVSALAVRWSRSMIDQNS
jgi:hypothetical protein